MSAPAPVASKRSVFPVVGPSKPRPVKETEISIISWVNDMEKWNSILLSNLHPVWAFQKGDTAVEFIAVTPDEGARSMGEAYEIGRLRARSEVRCYFHQDMTVLDPSFYLKLLSISRVCPTIGALGFVGTRVDTGASWMHSNKCDAVGIHLTNRQVSAFSDVSFEPVKLVDGFGFMTLPAAASIQWPDCYEGPHMAVEHMCMAVRDRGLGLWTIDSPAYHKSPGQIDDSYWRSALTFYEAWHASMGPTARHPAEIKAYYDRFNTTQDHWWEEGYKG